MIILKSLTKKFGHRVIFKDLSYHFPESERIALVGPNGTGKTTLLNILCNLDEADSGEVAIPRKVVIGYLPQEPHPHPAPTILEECLAGALEVSKVRRQRDEALSAMEKEFSEALYEAYESAESLYLQMGGYALEGEAESLLKGLGFRKDQFDQSPLTLSGGWRMRLEIGKMLLNKPNFLILDEPTNHLDLPSLIWFEDFLRGFKGTLLFVSHDKELLNRLSTMTLHLHKGSLVPYKGNFDAFLEAYELKQSQNQNALKHLQQRYADVERFVERFKAKPSKAAQARSRMKMLTRLKAMEGTIEVDDAPPEMAFSLPVNSPSGKHILHLKEGSIGYGSTALSRKLHLKMERGQKVAIIGANGIGKSTLLKSLLGHLPFLKGDLEWGHNVKPAYFAQEQLSFLEGGRTILENMTLLNPQVSDQKARAFLGNFLFRGDDVFKKVSVLSGGEKSRAGLCALLLKEANFLVLDEPTNHLDISSVTILSQALSDYEGSLLFVSHNRDFINGVATHIFAMTPDGRSALFEGNLDDYPKLASKSGFPNVLTM